MAQAWTETSGGATGRVKAKDASKCAWEGVEGNRLPYARGSSQSVDSDQMTVVRPLSISALDD